MVSLEEIGRVEEEGENELKWIDRGRSMKTDVVVGEKDRKGEGYREIEGSRESVYKGKRSRKGKREKQGGTEKEKGKERQRKEPIRERKYSNRGYSYGI